MREIKFRARDKATGKWYYGTSELNTKDWLFGTTEPLIPLSVFWHWLRGGLLDAKTVGQFTGRQDEGDIDVYEGDVVDGISEYCDLPLPVIWHRTGWYVGYVGTVTNVTSLDAIGKVEVLGNVWEEK